MTSVFISYRRSDSSGSTGRISDRLQAHFGDSSIFYDVDTIPLGIDFRTYLNERLDQCDAFLAIIGDQWLDVRGDDGERRLDDDADNVRLEVATALGREDIPVIPVLVGKAGVPKEDDLPESLKALAYRNAIQVSSDADFGGQMSRLITAIERIVSRDESGQSAAGEVPGPSAASPSRTAKEAQPDAPPAAGAKAPPTAHEPARSSSKKGLIAVAVLGLAALGVWYAFGSIDGGETGYSSGADAYATYESLVAECNEQPTWEWGCEVPAIPTVEPFLRGTCACSGRILQHVATGLYRCESLPESCGGVSFLETLGYPPEPDWYEEVTSH